MDRFDVSSVSSAPVPLHVPDKRPTADAAALARNPRPEVPLPVAAPQPQQVTNTSYVASVSRSLMLATGVEEAEKTRSIAPATEIQRTLKPYGIRMLPDDQSAGRKPETAAEPDRKPEAGPPAEPAP